MKPLLITVLTFFITTAFAQTVGGGLPVMRQHYYTDYDHFKTGEYGYFGYYNPFSLY